MVTSVLQWEMGYCLTLFLFLVPLLLITVNKNGLLEVEANKFKLSNPLVSLLFCHFERIRRNRRHANQHQQQRRPLEGVECYSAGDWGHQRKRSVAAKWILWTIYIV